MASVYFKDQLYQGYNLTHWSMGKKSLSLKTQCQMLFTPQPFGLEAYCHHGVGGRLPNCRTHIFVTACQIFSIWSSVELSRPLVVHCHSHLPICPIWACPWAKNLSNLPQIGSKLCGTHISETAGWIYTIWSSMELSRPVVVQQHGHLTLTLDFQGQILKLLYLRNGRANWHGTKGMWVDRMLHPLCDFQRSPYPWPWPWIFKVKFCKKSYLRNGMADWHEIKGR